MVNEKHKKNKWSEKCAFDIYFSWFEMSINFPYYWLMHSATNRGQTALVEVWASAFLLKLEPSPFFHQMISTAHIGSGYTLRSLEFCQSPRLVRRTTGESLCPESRKPCAGSIRRSKSSTLISSREFWSSSKIGNYQNKKWQGKGWRWPTNFL